jgi:RNA polymerase sigma factor (sigma-70 family)
MPTSTNYRIPEQKENDLLQSLTCNDPRRFSELYDNFSAALFGLIMRWIRDTEVAENLLQDVFMKAWRCREQYDASKGRLYTWLYNITRCICIDYLRSKAHRLNKASMLSDNVAVIIPTGNIDSPQPDTIGLRKLVNTLRREERELIELMYFKGFTQREIATMMNVPLGTVKTRMSRAIRNLRYYFKMDWKQGIQSISLN